MHRTGLIRTSTDNINVTKLNTMRNVTVKFKTNLSTNEISNILDKLCMRDLDDLGNESATWEIK